MIRGPRTRSKYQHFGYAPSDSTDRTPNTHLQEYDDLLPGCQATQVHRRESAYSHCAERVEERIDVTEGIFPIGCVQYSRPNQWDEGAVAEISELWSHRRNMPQRTRKASEPERS